MQNRKYLFFLMIAVVCAFTGIAQKQQSVTTVLTINTQSTGSVSEPGALHLGRYELYSGIPSIYLGHFILLANGKYKVAFDTDEENYDERGTYVWHSDTNTIEWQAGMFYSNNWGGKLTKTEKGFRIQFNKATYGDSK
ncbi:MAG: hypothetical protein ABI581_00670 [Sediminibacterium sp.]